MLNWQPIAENISHAIGQSFRVRKQRAIGGGCINEAYCLEDDEQRFFIKLNRADKLDMFAAEAEGLGEISATDTLRAPRPICWGESSGRAYLVMEYFQLNGGSHHVSRLGGEQLALLHRTIKPRFGWHRDNTIGSTPQLNDWDEEWARFWREKRLGYQLQLAAYNGYHSSVLQDRGALLQEQLDGFFSSYHPVASLLHGDLWGGNYAVGADNQPLIFDPAVYYGDREADLAMTELFGGFDSEFYAAYNSTWPLDAGYKTRKTLYNLYHILNHLNLFGSGYLGQAERMIQVLLSEL